MAEMYDPLLDLLVQNGVLDDEQVATIREEQKNDGGKPIRQLVIDGGYATEDDLLAMMAAYQGCEVIDLAAMTLDTDTVNAIPASIARMYNVLCVGVDDTSVTLATANLVDPRVSDEVAFALTKEVRFVMAREADVNERIAQHYGDASDSVADMLKSLGEGLDGDESLKNEPLLRGSNGKCVYPKAKGGKTLRLVDKNGKELDAEKILAELPKPAPQQTDFIDSCKNRKTFALNESNGFRSCTMFNLGIAAERLGRGFEFDPVTLHAKNDPAADRFLYQSMRSPWDREMWG